MEAVGAATYANVAVFGGLTATNFILTFNSSSGRGAVSGIQIMSNDHPAAPVILSFTTDGYYVVPGTEVTLSWETSNGVALAISPGIDDGVADTGSTTVVVNASTNLLSWSPVADEIPSAASGNSTTLPLGAVPELPGFYRIVIR